jgi:hypothetical protein
MGGTGGFAKGGKVGKMGKEGSPIEERTESRREAGREGDLRGFAKGGLVSTDRHGPGKTVSSSSGDAKPRHSRSGKGG